MVGNLIGRRVQWSQGEVVTIEFVFLKTNAGMEKGFVDSPWLYAIIRRACGQCIETPVQNLNLLSDGPQASEK